MASAKMKKDLKSLIYRDVNPKGLASALFWKWQFLLNSAILSLPYGNLISHRVSWNKLWGGLSLRDNLQEKEGYHSWKE